MKEYSGLISLFIKEFSTTVNNYFLRIMQMILKHDSQISTPTPPVYPHIMFINVIYSRAIRHDFIYGTTYDCVFHSLWMLWSR